MAKSVKRLPRVMPIQPLALKRQISEGEYALDFKYDGFRGMLYLPEDKDRSHFISKTGKELARFKRLARQLSVILRKAETAIIDGEVVSLDATDRPVLLDLMKGVREPTYIAFDLLWLNGEDLRQLPLRERRKRLRQLIPRNSRTIKEAFSAPQKNLERMWDFIRDHDLEGIVLKRLDDPYTPAVKWYKIKNPKYSAPERTRKIFNPPKKPKSGT